MKYWPLVSRKGNESRVAQWKRAGPITQRSEDQNLALLDVLVFSFFFVLFQDSS